MLSYKTYSKQQCLLEAPCVYGIGSNLYTAHTSCRTAS
ncbi:virulence promoting factor (plasmid) [Paenibacillus peoriae]|uniref:Virulence promoting factor n=1 Tax=Paenibacillus peoriae TaxID=59893 RepID=A0A7H0YHE7_9BACL|nr:virulence promoting factor [Paenibacillus peoriae]